MKIFILKFCHKKREASIILSDKMISYNENPYFQNICIPAFWALNCLVWHRSRTHGETISGEMVWLFQERKWFNKCHQDTGMCLSTLMLANHADLAIRCVYRIGWQGQTHLQPLSCPCPLHASHSQSPTLQTAGSGWFASIKLLRPMPRMLVSWRGLMTHFGS